MLHVGVHDGDVICGGGEYALDTCGREAAASDAVDEADAGIAAGIITEELGGAVRGVIVDEDEFIDDALEGFGEAADEFRNVAALVEGGDDDGEIDTALGKLEERGFGGQLWEGGAETHLQRQSFHAGERVRNDLQGRRTAGVAEA